ncbi:MAG: four helix bundle protein [Candidatus Paceibacterota bacterium]|jgi:four helix bundle protein
MSIEKFEDIKAWIKAKELTIFIYKLFSQSKDFSFRNQIERASVSIMNNIAEGFERKGDKEFKQFLFIAKGSCGEVRSMLSLGLDLSYLSDKDYIFANNLSIEISKILSGLIKVLKS